MDSVSDKGYVVRMNGRESKAFNVKVGVYQGSVLSPLLFIIVLEALSREFREGLPMEFGQAEDSGEHPCGVCRKVVGRNSIFCVECRRWVHKI